VGDDLRRQVIGVDDESGKARILEDTRVADLPPGLGIDGRAVEDDLPLLPRLETVGALPVLEDGEDLDVGDLGALMRLGPDAEVFSVPRRPSGPSA
jgi:hypothetical protein